MTREKPILFSAPMVRAILNGTKTQTRRVVKLKSHHTIEERDDGKPWPWMYDGDRDADHWLPCPYGQPGDRLWVRETWGDCTKGADIMGGTKYDAPWYRADADAYGLLGHDGLGAVYSEEIKWRPSIHMPRWASRITLEVTDVRVERLQDISIADAIAEGVVETNPNLRGLEPCLEWRYAYEDLWESINGPGSWDANPWVWVVEFALTTTSKGGE